MIAVPVQVFVLGALAATVAIAQNTMTESAPASAVSANRSGITINSGIYVPILHRCSKMKNYNWDNVKYACSWNHYSYGEYDNLFFKTYDGRYEYECHCDRDLSTYDPWGSRWTKSNDGLIRCVTRDGRSAAQVKSEFDSLSCPPVALDWIGGGGGGLRN